MSSLSLPGERALTARQPGLYDAALWLGGGALIGVVSWSGSMALLGLAPLFALLWGAASSRVAAGLAAAGYYLGSSWGLVLGAATYFEGPLLQGALFWLLGAAGSVAVMTLVWGRPGRGLRFLIGLLLTIVPPVGLVGWSNPLTAAGLWFPGLGWLGLGLMALVLGMAAEFGGRALARAGVIGAAGLAVVIAAAGVAQPKPPAGWAGLDLAMDQRGGPMDFMAAYARLMTVAGTLDALPATTVVLPETVAGWWTPTAEAAWQKLARASGKRLIIGAEREQGRGLDNLMIVLGRDGIEAVYRQRLPVPVSMWRPWSQRSFNAYGLANPVVVVDGRRVGFLLCYEQYLVWPILLSVAAGASLLVGSGNAWWAVGTNLASLQVGITQAWGRLFGVSVVTAVNRGAR